MILVWVMNNDCLTYDFSIFYCFFLAKIMQNNMADLGPDDTLDTGSVNP